MTQINSFWQAAVRQQLICAQLSACWYGLFLLTERGSAVPVLWGGNKPCDRDERKHRSHLVCVCWRLSYWTCSAWNLFASHYITTFNRPSVGSVWGCSSKYACMICIFLMIIPDDLCSYSVIMWNSLWPVPVCDLILHRQWGTVPNSSEHITCVVGCSFRWDGFMDWSAIAPMWPLQGVHLCFCVLICTVVC